MSKDYDDYDEYDEQDGKEYYDYDDEISRKAVGKLLNGLDDYDKKPSKPTVKTIRPESGGESKRSSINTSYYDDSRTSRYDDDDSIVTGFRDDDDDYYDSHDDEYEDDSEQIELEEFTEMEEEPEPARTRRPRPGSEETPADRQERERYRRQFLDGYTDTRRKGSDMAQTTDYKRRAPGASADDAVRRIAAEKEKEQDSAPRRRPRPTAGDSRPQSTPVRGRKPAEEDDDINIIAKRSERSRRERSQPVAAPSYGTTSAAPSYDAPIFKIIIAVFLIMLAVLVFLVFKINGANKTIAEHEANAAKIEVDSEAMAALQTSNDSLRQQLTTATDDKNNAILERDAYKTQLEELQGSSANAAAPPAGGQATSQTPLPGGSQSYTVVSGDSLSRISNRFYSNSSAASIKAIKDANNMSSDVVHVGQTLIIPAQQ